MEHIVFFFLNMHAHTQRALPDGPVGAHGGVDSVLALGEAAQPAHLHPADHRGLHSGEGKRYSCFILLC